MPTLNTCHSDDVKTYLDDPEHIHLRGLLQAGGQSPVVGEFDTAYFESLRRFLRTCSCQSESL